MPFNLLLGRRSYFSLFFALATTPLCAAGVDFTWQTVGAPGNPGYTGPDVNGQTTGRGSVDYDYRISRYELTTEQWLEFANAFGPMGDPFRIGQGTRGAFERDFSYGGPGLRFRLNPMIPNAGQVPVAMSWRNAARYCNWLQNNKAPTLEALETGAYDATTFRRDPVTNEPLDSPSRLPGAEYWIPNFDELLKAEHYDPNRDGPGRGGYWMYPNSSDTPPIIGPADGGGQTNATTGDTLPWSSRWVGSYPDVQTPWGLLDASGGMSEWTEEPYFGSLGLRRYDGAPFPQTDPGYLILDLVYLSGSYDVDSEGGYIGLRIATSVPAPSPLLVIAFPVFGMILRSTRSRSFFHG